MDPTVKFITKYKVIGEALPEELPPGFVQDPDYPKPIKVRYKHNAKWHTTIWLYPNFDMQLDDHLLVCPVERHGGRL